MSINNVRLENATGSMILADLRRMCPNIPAKGILAGGAICDWFLGKQPNDFDVFVLEDNAYPDAVPRCMARFGIPESDMYFGIPTIAWKGLYRVQSSKNEGLLNIITCTGTDLSTAILISGFDLNATMVGIDLETEKLVYDEAFSEFLKTRKLKVMRMFTPAHTAIRYFNKKDHLQAEGDDDVEMEILMTAWYWDRIGNDGYSLPHRFGEMYKAKAVKAMSLGLDEYFELVEEDGLWTLHPTKVSTFTNSEHFAGVLFPAIAPQALRSQKIDPPASYLEKIEILRNRTSSHAIHRMIDLFNGAYVRGKFTDELISTVVDALEFSPRLETVLMGFHLERQAQIVRRIHRFAKRNGPWIYDLVIKRGIPLDVVTNSSFEDFIARNESHYTEEMYPGSAPSIHLNRFFTSQIIKVKSIKHFYELNQECQGGKYRDIGDLFAKSGSVYYVRSRTEGKSYFASFQHLYGRTFFIGVLDADGFAFNPKIGVLWIMSKLNSSGNFGSIVDFASKLRPFIRRSITSKFLGL